MAPPGECYYNTVLCCDYLSSLGVVLRAFSKLCVYSKFEHHPHLLGYLFAKFRFFCSLHCWGSPWRKIAYSITHPAFLSSSVVSHAFSALCMYSKFGHIPHPQILFLSWPLLLSYPMEKNAYSITHKAYLMPREPKHLWFVIRDIKI